MPQGGMRVGAIVVAGFCAPLESSPRDTLRCRGCCFLTPAVHWIVYVGVWTVALTPGDLSLSAEESKNLEMMRKFAEQYAKRTGTYFCVDKSVTSVVIKVGGSLSGP